MYRQMLRAKIHRMRVTQANLEYEGSLTLDRDLMDAAGLLPNERIEIYNVTSGSRLATYVIEGGRGTGVCCVNGAAAHLASEGDHVILAAYGLVPERDAARHRPVIVLVDENNRPRDVKSAEREDAKVS